MTEQIETTPKAKFTINYIFFTFYFFIISLLHVIHITLIEKTLSLSQYFFSIYAISQCFLEALFLTIVTQLIRSYFPRLFNLSILLTFFLFLSHLIDFPLVRLMDMTFWYALHFVSQESYENFIELLLASNVSLLVWACAALGGVALLLSGLFLFRLTERLAQKKSWAPSLTFLGAVLGTTFLFLLSWDYGVRGHVNGAFCDRYQKTLPWKTTFFPHHLERIFLKKSLSSLPSYKELNQKIDPHLLKLSTLPDLYLFVIESLREDFIIPEIAPSLSRFKKDNLSFPIALSNANATHISWFSLFHSQFPFYWRNDQKEHRKKGSLPLHLLKKMGYKIHVCSSTRLSYYQMDQILFGEATHLANSLFIPEDEETIEPYQRDQKAMDHLLKEMGKEKGGRLFVVFLDGTHLDYSWPKEASKFFPFDDKINYFSAAVSQSGVERIKNRYKNALHFVDSLFGNFLNALEKTTGGDEAVVIVTGDHGEEFYEHGNLFHASNLSHPQMHVPLYYRFGQMQSLEEIPEMSCHMDIFPSLFHYLTGEDLTKGILQGQSIFTKERWPYTVIARFNASRNPYQFCIHNGSQKLLAEFDNQQDIFQAKELRIFGTKNCRDENLFEEMGIVYEKFGPAFERFFP